MTGAEQAVLLPAVVAGVGVLAWAVETRLAGTARWLHGRYTLRPDHAAWLLPEETPPGWLPVVWLDCDGPCRARTPYAVDGPAARCHACGTHRATAPARGRRPHPLHVPGGHMSDYSEIAARFARDTARHTMTVLHDDGLYRHLLFRDRQHSSYWFELITTPGQLVFSGDGESVVFRRITDMFEFFRWGIWRDGSLNINPHYWSEKLTSDRDSVMAYSDDLFEQQVADELKAAEPLYPGVTEAWKEHVESEFNTEYEEEARRALDEFEFGVRHKADCSWCGRGLVADTHTEAALWCGKHLRDHGSTHTVSIERLGFTFTDTWEWQLRDFDWWYLWACHAIVWGIARYDRVRSYGVQPLAAPKAVA